MYPEQKSSQLSLIDDFRHAIENDDVDKVQSIILNNPTIVHSTVLRTSNGTLFTPLWIAVMYEREKIVELLIDYGAEVDQVVPYSNENFFRDLTILHCVVFFDQRWKRRKKMAQILIRRGADVNATGLLKSWPRTPFTPLRLAIIYGDVRYVKFLLSNGARLQCTKWDQLDTVRVVLAAPKTKQKDLLQLLIDSGLDTKIRIVYLSMMNYIHFSIGVAINRKLDIDIVELVKIFLNSGLQINDKDVLGRSALFFAIELENIELVSFLIDRGADVNAETKDGSRPLKLAVERNNVKIIDLLLLNGVDINDTDVLGRTALFLAIDLENIELCSFLIDRGADVNAETKDGSRPLQLAVELNNVKLIDLLWLNCVDLNAKMICEFTALHEACYHRLEEVIDFLIKKGADINVADAHGETPFLLLEPVEYHESDVPCINIMVKEIAKRKFFHDSYVSEKDMDVIRAHTILLQLYETYMEELLSMSRCKFYASYSYGYVLKMSKNSIQKLAKLTKNKELVKSFKESLYMFPKYENELQKIFEEAIQIRNESLIIDSRLKLIFGDFLTDLVIDKLGENLSVEDLPQ